MTVANLPPRRPTPWRLGTWLLALCLAVLVPPVLVAVAGVVDQARARDEDAQAALRRRATSASRTVGQELQAVRQTLHAVAQSESVGRGDLAGLHAFATRLAALDPRLEAIQLVQRGGRMPFTTAAPYGTVLPPLSREGIAESIQRGAPSVSPVSLDPVTRQPLAAVELPLDVHGLGPCLLRAVIRADALAHALDQHVWPDEWVAAVVDQDFAVVVRSRDGDRLAGQPAYPSVRPQVEAGRSDFDAQSIDGTPVRVHVSPVPGTRWTTAVAIPLAATEDPLWRALGTVLVAAAVCAASGLALSRLLARVLVREVRSIGAAQAGAWSHGVPAGRVAELAELGAVLQAAWPRTASEGDAREPGDAAPVEDTRDAPDTRDAVTGLPVRASLLARAQGLARGAAARGESVAVLFVDVAGVRRVVDTLGDEAGTSVLRRIADVLRRQAGGAALAGRLGADRFVLCTAVSRSHGADRASERARGILQETRVLGLGIDCRVSTALAHDAHQLRALLDGRDATAPAPAAAPAPAPA